MEIKEGKKTVCYYVERLVDVYKNRTALVYRKDYRSENWSYSDLYNYAHRIAGFFEEKCIRKDDKVLIYSYNSPEWGAILLACAITGVIAVPLDFNSTTDFVSEIYRRVNAKALFSSKFKRAASKLPREVFIEDLFETVKKHHQYRCKADIKEDDILEIVYTSGTTSDPKGVIITNRNLVADIRAMREIMPLSRNNVFLSLLPLSHLLEQTAGFFTPLRFGCKIVYLKSRKSSSIVEALGDEKVTAIVAVPSILSTLREKVEREAERANKSAELHRGLMKAVKYPFFIRRIIFRKILKNLGGRLRWFLVGGAPLDKGLELFWDSLGILAVQGYGLTEASPIVACNRFNDYKIGTVGKAIPNQKLKLLEGGEIAIKGENVTKGYYRNSKATHDRIKGGWFYTGDIGEFDEEGYLTIKGRKKDMILSSSGMNVYPEDIENMLNRQEEVKASCVLGIKGNKDIVVTAAVLPKEGYTIREKGFLSQINKSLSSAQQIQRLVIWKEEDFPRTPTFKIIRRAVEVEIKSESKWKPITLFKNPLYKILAEISNARKIKPSSNLSSDLRIDSLRRVELVSIIEENFGVEIDESLIDANTTVNDLDCLIKKSQQMQKKLEFKALPLSLPELLVREMLQYIFFFAMRLFCRVKVEGANNLKDITEPVVFAANHQSHLDTPIILGVLPRAMRAKTAVAAAKDYFFDIEGNFLRKIGKFLFREFTVLLFNTYPFAREGSIRESLKYSGKLLDKGFSILLFPEGTRSTNGKISHFKAGIGLFASEMSVPIVPIKIEGSYSILPKGRFFPSFGNVTVKIGRLININEEKSYLGIAEKIECQIKRL